MKDAWKFLSGSILTYVLIAACADKPRSAGHIATNGGSTGTHVASGGTRPGDAMSGGSHNELSDGGNESVVDAAVDAMLDPIPDAAAEPATDGTRLKAIYLVGDDGSKQFNGWWDSKLNAECSSMPFENGSSRCVPATGPFQAFFADAACTQLLFIASAATSCPGANVRYGFGTSSNTCDAAYTAFYKLTAVDPPKVYALSASVCTDVTTGAKPTPPTYLFYTGAQMPLSDFVAATKQHG